MNVLYIPQLDETVGDGMSGRYRLLRRVPEDGTVNLADLAVTRVELAESNPLRLVVPPLVKGAVRDFFVRLVITAEEIPEVTFAAPSGETISFENTDDDVFKCEFGVNIYAFTETDEGIFIVNRKQVDIDVEVAFDPCGGDLDEAKRTFKLGATYGTLPKPSMDGHTFLGWFTAPEGGVKVDAGDRCKTGVTELYARWETYVDPFADFICPTRNLTFFSEDAIPWAADTETYASDPGSARSGRIPDNDSSSITTTVRGRGTLSFKWKVSSESSYDKLHFIVDGYNVADISGSRDWATRTQTFTTGGAHAVEWKYDKDGSNSVGSDCGWIDDVTWTPAEG